MKFMTHFALLALPMVLAGCSPKPETATESSTTSAPAATPATPASSTPRLFFVEPKDGDTVKSPVHLKFGTENFMIMPVPEGEVTTVRPGMGHHHFAIDADCLPPGTVIPKGANWVHLGTGATEIDTQLTPGPHKLTLEIGDDKHMTLEGMCQTITVNVAP